MRMTDQIKLANDFFKDYRELKKESARLHEQGIPVNQRKDWAEDYFDTWNGSRILLIQSK
jgi:hypothetical protein